MTLTASQPSSASLQRGRLGSSDPFGDFNYPTKAGKPAFGASEPQFHSKYKSKANIQLEEAMQRIPLCRSAGIDRMTTAPNSPTMSKSLHSSLCIVRNPLSASAPASPSFTLRAPTPAKLASVPSKYATTPKSTPPPTLIKRFHDLVKYVNIPDVLHGLENFGYLSSDQSIELFACVMELRSQIPELEKVLQYEEHEQPICTVQHFGVTCDSCLTADICGTRYKCAICPDFDMCENCERKGILTHDITHPRIKMLVPSDCTFEHNCRTHNAQGEKIEPECPFPQNHKAPTSPSVPLSTPTYQKRQLQFSTLHKRKQLREAVRKVQRQEAERLRQETMKQQEQKREEEEKRMKEQQNELSSSGQQQQQPEPGKSILWGYFDNLKKQNKLQIIDSTVTTVPTVPTVPTVTTVPKTTPLIPNKPIAISGNLTASTSSMASSSGVLNSLANSTTSNSSAVASPPMIRISSSSSSTSMSSSSSGPSSGADVSPLSSSLASLSCARMTAISGPISSRLQPVQSFSPMSPECSPMFPSPALSQSIGSPVPPRRASVLKQNTTIQREEVQPVVAQAKQRRDLTDVLREIGMPFMTDSDQSDTESDLSDSTGSDSTPSPKKESPSKLKENGSFFSSLRELLK